MKYRCQTEIEYVSWGGVLANTLLQGHFPEEEKAMDNAFVHFLPGGALFYRVRMCNFPQKKKVSILYLYLYAYSCPLPPPFCFLLFCLFDLRNKIFPCFDRVIAAACVLSKGACRRIPCSVRGV